MPSTPAPPVMCSLAAKSSEVKKIAPLRSIFTVDNGINFCPCYITLFDGQFRFASIDAKMSIDAFGTHPIVGGLPRSWVTRSKEKFQQWRIVSLLVLPSSIITCQTAFVSIYLDLRLGHCSKQSQIWSLKERKDRSCDEASEEKNLFVERSVFLYFRRKFLQNSGWVISRSLSFHSDPG